MFLYLLLAISRKSKSGILNKLRGSVRLNLGRRLQVWCQKGCGLEMMWTLSLEDLMKKMKMVEAKLQHDFQEEL